MTDKEILGSSWHWVVEDQLGFNFAISVMLQDGEITENEAKSVAERIEKIYDDYFLERFGAKLFDKCPHCSEGKVVLRESRYGQFMSCDQFPACKNTYTDKKRRKKSNEAKA